MIDSRQNGTITIRRSFHRVKVFAHGYEQGSRYLVKMWQGALRRMKSNHTVKQILMLGLGGGQTLQMLSKRFPDAHIMVIEWDPVMVELAKSLFPFSQTQPPEIRIVDAFDFVQTCQQTFDVILIDLFTGGVPEPRLASPEMIKGLLHLLSRDGHLFLNFYKTRELEQKFSNVFSHRETWRYRYNEIAWFRHFGAGNICDPIPEWYVDKTQSMIYAQTQQGGVDHKEMVTTKGGIRGTRSHVGPFYYESYVSESEPMLESFSSTRLVTWQPLCKIKKQGWFPAWYADRPLQYGIVRVDREDYWTLWSQHARRHRDKWRKDHRYEIVKTDLTTFSKAYHATKKLDWFTRFAFVKVLQYHLDRHPHDVHLFVVREKDSQKILAGLGVIDYPDITQSLHTIAFLNRGMQSSSIGIGLIDHWYTHSRASGITCLNFGVVWKEGDPKSWQGYSKFKKQFGLYLIQYPRPLFKIAFGMRI